jgi:hypothetical protein
VSGGERRRSAPASGSRSLRPRVAAPVAVDPVARLSLPLGLSGLSAAAVLAGPGRLGLGTVRDLCSTCPAGDDLRELRRSATCTRSRTAQWSAAGRVTDIRVSRRGGAASR